MNSFLHLYSIYRSVTRLQILIRIYSESKPVWKIALWSTKSLFVVLIAVMFFLHSRQPFFSVAIGVAVTWAWLFTKARNAVFLEIYKPYPEQIKYFGMGYQFPRYLAFREKLIANERFESVPAALTFVENQLETDSPTSISSHPILTFLFGVLFAVLGGAAGQWQEKYIAAILLVVVVVIYFSYMTLGMVRTQETKLKEFKQFLLWIKDDQDLISKRQVVK